MSLITPELPFRKRRVFPLWAPFAAGLVLAAAGVAFLYFDFQFLRSTEAKAKRLEREFEARQTKEEVKRKNAEEEAKLTLARNRQDEVLRVVRREANALSELLSLVKMVSAQASALQTNRAGNAISAFPELVLEARRIFSETSENFPTAGEVLQKLEIAKRTEAQVLAAAGTLYIPGELSESSQEMLTWAETQKLLASQMRARLNFLEREGKTRPVPVAAPAPAPLLESVEAVTAKEAAAHDAALEDLTSPAKRVAIETEAAAVSNKIVVVAMEKRAESDIETRRVENTVRKKLLREKASRPDIQSALAPFISPGHFVPRKGGKFSDKFGYDNRPMSLSELRQVGALNSNLAGLKALASVGTSRYNDRPHLPVDFQRTAWFRSAELLDEARNLQQLLIELGDTLVEMGLLAP